MRRRKIPDQEYCHYCAKLIPEQQYEIHRLRCREKSLNEAMWVQDQEEYNSNSNNISSRQKSLGGSNLNSNLCGEINQKSEQLNFCVSEGTQEQEKKKKSIETKSEQVNKQQQHVVQEQMLMIDQISQDQHLQATQVSSQNNQNLETQSLPQYTIQIQVENAVENDQVNLGFVTVLNRIFHSQVLSRIDNLIWNFLSHLHDDDSDEQNGLTTQQIDQLQKKVATGQQQTICPICQCNFQIGQSLLILRCNHLFHQSCLSTWLKMKSKCPTCRFGLLPSDVD